MTDSIDLEKVPNQALLAELARRREEIIKKQEQLRGERIKVECPTCDRSGTVANPDSEVSCGRLPPRSPCYTCGGEGTLLVYKVK